MKSKSIYYKGRKDPTCIIKKSTEFFIRNVIDLLNTCWLYNSTIMNLNDELVNRGLSIEKTLHKYDISSLKIKTAFDRRKRTAKIIYKRPLVYFENIINGEKLCGMTEEDDLSGVLTLLEIILEYDNGSERQQEMVKGIQYLLDNDLYGMYAIVDWMFIEQDGANLIKNSNISDDDKVLFLKFYHANSAHHEKKDILAKIHLRLEPYKNSTLFSSEDDWFKNTLESAISHISNIANNLKGVRHNKVHV